jgi:hypothetical protein
MSRSILCNTAAIIIIIIIIVVVVVTTTTVTTVEIIRFRSRMNDSINQYSLYQSFTGVVSHSLQFLPPNFFPLFLPSDHCTGHSW